MDHNSTKMPHVFIYSRKSRFSGAGESIENQIEMCKMHAQRIYPAGCIFRIYEDEGFSAKNVDRPQWQQLMSDINNLPCNVLICYRLDRISRSVSDFSGILEYMVDRNIDFVSVRENFDTSTPMGRAMIYIASVFAQLERETITERIRDNKFRLYRTGRWQGGLAPLGYTAVKSSHHDEGGAKRHLYILEGIPEEQAHVRFLYDKFVELGSLTALDRYLLEHRILSANGNEYRPSTLRQLLINPIYAPNAPIVYDYLASLGCDIVDNRETFDSKNGLISYARTVTKGSKNTTRTRNSTDGWIIATGEHTGLIPGAQWVHVQQVLHENGKKRPRQGTSSIALLSGLIRCGKCGAPMMLKGNRDNAAGDKVYYYVCEKKSRSHGSLCDITNIQGRQFDLYVIERLKETFSSGSKIFTALDSQFKPIQTGKIDYQKRIRQLEQRIEQNNTASVTLAGKMAYTQSDAEDEALRQAIQKLANEQKLLQSELNLIRQRALSSDSGVISLEIMKAAIQSFVQGFDALELEAKRQSVKNIIQMITWNESNAEIQLFPAIEAAAKKRK